MKEKTTHFGYEEIPISEKTKKVEQVFSSVATKYDIMNDVMSAGLHRIWKRIAIHHLNLRPGQHILDLAGGTGDLTRHISPRIGTSGQVILADINADMLAVGKDRLLNLGLYNNISVQQVNAEELPFSSNHFDRTIIGFGLRNVTDKDKALQEMYRTLRPGGKLIILEFSHPTSSILQKLYDSYSFSLLPKMGSLIANDADSYQYLAESIRRHPNQATLEDMLMSAGFEDTGHTNLTGGIVAIHRGHKY